MNSRTRLCLAAVVTIFLIRGVVLSHRIEPDISVKKVTIAKNTPPLQFVPKLRGYGFAPADVSRSSVRVASLPVFIASDRSCIVLFSSAISRSSASSSGMECAQVCVTAAGKEKGKLIRGLAKTRDPTKQCTVRPFPRCVCIIS
jgi:hypothetical protein